MSNSNDQKIKEQLKRIQEFKKFKEQILDDTGGMYGGGISPKEYLKLEEDLGKTERLLYLQLLAMKRHDTLAQQIELQKMYFQNSKLGKVAGNIGKYGALTGNIVGTAASTVLNTSTDLAKTVASSKAGKGTIEALMYSNPLTALLYENRDIIKGVGKAGIGLGKGVGKIGAGIGSLGFNIASDVYSLIRNKKEQNQISDTSQLLLTGKQKAFENKQAKALLEDKQKMEGKQLLLEDKKQKEQNKKQLLLEDKQHKETAKISKGIAGLLTQAKESNKVLSMIKNKYIITGGLVLLGIVGIVAAINAIRDRIEKLFPKSTPNATPAAQIEAFKKLSQTTEQDINTKLQNSVKNADKISESSINKLTKITKIGGFNTGLKSGFEAQSKEGDPYPAPFDLKILDIKVNIKKVGIVDIYAERLDNKTHNNITIMNVMNPLVVPYDYDKTKEKKYSMVKKGTIIGFVGPTGKIQIKDMNEKAFNQYISETNKGIESGEVTIPEISQERMDYINRYMSGISDAYKSYDPRSNSAIGESSVLYQEQQKRFQENRRKVNVKTLQEAIDNNLNGTYIEGRFIPKERLRDELNKYNKNVTNATTKVDQAKPETKTNNSNDKKSDAALNKISEAISTIPITSNELTTISFEVTDPASTLEQTTTTYKFG